MPSAASLVSSLRPLLNHVFLRSQTFIHNVLIAKRYEIGLIRHLKNADLQRLLLRNNINVILIVLFGLLQVADGAITYIGLCFADVNEVNPLLNFCAEHIGLGMSITMVKFVILLAIAFLFCTRHKMKSRWNTATLASAVSFYSWVVTNNVNLVMNG